MTLKPDLTERLARARGDLRMGVPVVLAEGFVILAVETLTQTRFDMLRSLGANPTLSITGWRAKTLKAHAYDGDIARIALPDYATMTWVRSIADPADDLNHPMKGPLRAQRDGPAGPLRAAIALTKAARLLPSVLSIEIFDPIAFAAEHDLTLVSGAAADPADVGALDRVIHAGLPMDASEQGRVHIFRPDNGGEERAMAQMGAEGAGVLLYLNQEGRGIGLANKMRAYSLQDQGFDTVEANHRLGFEDDERDFRIGADILKQMGFNDVRLLTNNPAKVAKLESCGLLVSERVALKVGENRHNQNYLATKAAKSGHIF